MKLQHTLWVTYIVRLEPTNLENHPKSWKIGQWVSSWEELRRQGERYIIKAEQSTSFAWRRSVLQPHLSPRCHFSAHRQDSPKVLWTSVLLTEGPWKDLSAHSSPTKQKKRSSTAARNQKQSCLIHVANSKGSCSSQSTSDTQFTLSLQLQKGYLGYSTKAGCGQPK